MLLTFIRGPVAVFLFLWTAEQVGFYLHSALCHH